MTETLPGTVDSKGKATLTGDRVKIVASGHGANPGHVGREGTVVGVARLRARVVVDGEEQPRRMNPDQFVRVPTKRGSRRLQPV